jgi:hypothetical protein
MNFTGHDLFFTVGTNFGSPEVRLPRTAQEWIPLRPVVAGEYWRKRLAEAGGTEGKDAWSTVSHWYGYNDLVWEGKIYGGKRDSLHALRDLPRLSGQAFAIASDLQPGWEDYDAYIDGGWRLVSSAEVCRNVSAYLRFIAGSRGEIGVAKGGYVVSRGGWISDRSVIYLALGRPVVLQETGWTSAVTTREGLLPFVTAEDAAVRVAEIEAAYDSHQTAARQLADTVFGPTDALKPLLERVGSR